MPQKSKLAVKLCCSALILPHLSDPTPTRDPLMENVRWPTARSNGNEYLSYLDIGKHLVVKTGIFKNIPFWQKLFKKFGNPPYSTY